jgi:hypothetical protein
MSMFASPTLVRVFAVCLLSLSALSACNLAAFPGDPPDTIYSTFDGHDAWFLVREDGTDRQGRRVVLVRGGMGRFYIPDQDLDTRMAKARAFRERIEALAVQACGGEPIALEGGVGWAGGGYRFACPRR